MTLAVRPPLSVTVFVARACAVPLRSATTQSTWIVVVAEVHAVAVEGLLLGDLEGDLDQRHRQIDVDLGAVLFHDPNVDPGCLRVLRGAHDPDPAELPQLQQTPISGNQPMRTRSDGAFEHSIVGLICYGVDRLGWSLDERVRANAGKELRDLMLVEADLGIHELPAELCQ